MNSPILTIRKPIGITPLEAIERFKQQHTEYVNKTISYAGRLDPMADGLLLLLVGEQNKRRQEFEALEKTYEFTVLLGVETDTYDLLGKPQQTHIVTADSQRETQIRQANFSDILASFIGTHMQPYPPYSSRTVQGKPLYWWARNNRLGEITIPTKEVTIVSSDFLSLRTITSYDLQQHILHCISRIKGDFRQQEILQSWERFFSSNSGTDNQTTQQAMFHLVDCRVSCSSGTYVRSIAHTIGHKLTIGALAFSITRIKIGDYQLKDAMNI